MPTFEKLSGLISLASNTPGAPTGYGQQAQYLVERLVRHGIKTASLSNYGLEGSVGSLRVKHGEVAHYPRGVAPYSQDVLTPWHEAHRTHYDRTLKHALMTLYDVWVYNAWQGDAPIISWVPLDHVTMPPGVAEWLRRDQVTPVAMSPFGQRQLAGADIDSVYIPHGVDTKVFQRTSKVDGVSGRDFLGVPDDTFLVSMVAANKADGRVHRKAFGENFLAFAMFLEKRPDAHLYVHADPAPNSGGFDLGVLAKAVGIPVSKITFANRDQLRVGYSQERLASIYSVSDVLLAPSYGEGFGVPTVEAQACGTRVIASGWAASADLVADDGFLVEGQPFWDEPQKAFFQVPLVGSVVSALVQAYDVGQGFSAVSRKFALQFDVETVWDGLWMPFLRDYFAS